MKALLLLLVAFCAVAYGSDRLIGRNLLGEGAEYCPNYEGPRHLQKDMQFEVIHLSPKPLPEQKKHYEGLLNRPLGTLFGRAIVRLSTKLGIDVKHSFFRVTNLPGDIFGVKVSEDKCEVILDFFVFTKCEDQCVPMGACVELNRAVLASETGYKDLPYRKGCRALLPEDRPRCLDLDVIALGMGVDKKLGMPYTNEKKAQLMMMFNAPFAEFVDVKPKDFVVYGPPGTKLEECKAAMPGDPKNIAYTLHLTHGDTNGADEMIEVCLDTTKMIQDNGMPYPASKEMCVHYMKTAKGPKEIKSSMMMRESHAPTKFC